MRFIVAAITVALSVGNLIACGTVPLTRTGQRVNNAPLKDVSRCKHVGLVTGTASGSGWGGDANKLLKNAMNSLRNEAGKLGATDVIPGSASTVTNETGSPVSATLMGNAYNCYIPATPDAAAPAQPGAVSQQPKGPATGTERGKCYGNNTCNAGLTCASDLCVKLP